jgi:hypothetical protein
MRLYLICHRQIVILGENENLKTRTLKNNQNKIYNKQIYRHVFVEVATK